MGRGGDNNDDDDATSGGTPPRPPPGGPRRHQSARLGKSSRSRSSPRLPTLGEPASRGDYEPTAVAGEPISTSASTSSSSLASGGGAAAGGTGPASGGRKSRRKHSRGAEGEGAGSDGLRRRKSFSRKTGAAAAAAASVAAGDGNDDDGDHQQLAAIARPPQGGFGGAAGSGSGGDRKHEYSHSPLPDALEMAAMMRAGGRGRSTSAGDAGDGGDEDAEGRSDRARRHRDKRDRRDRRGNGELSHSGASASSSTADDGGGGFGAEHRLPGLHGSVDNEVLQQKQPGAAEHTPVLTVVSAGSDRLAALMRTGDVKAAKAFLQSKDLTMLSLPLDERNRTALHLAADEGHRALVQYLLDLSDHHHHHGSAASGAGGGGSGEGAAGAGKSGSKKNILARAVSVTSGSSSGSSGSSSSYGSYSQYQQGETPIVDMNARDSNGWTPLLAAAAARHADVCALLLQRGASPTLVNDQGTAAIHYLVRIRPSDVSVPGSVPGAGGGGGSTTSGGSVIAAAQEREYVNLLDLLLRADRGGGGHMIDAKTDLGFTALMNAAMARNVTAVRWLLAQGADWRLRNHHGVTATTYAEQTLDLDTMEPMVEAMEAAVAKLPTSRAEAVGAGGGSLFAPKDETDDAAEGALTGSGSSTGQRAKPQQQADAQRKAKKLSKKPSSKAKKGKKQGAAARRGRGRKASIAADLADTNPFAAAIRAQEQEGVTTTSSETASSSGSDDGAAGSAAAARDEEDPYTDASARLSATPMGMQRVAPPPIRHFGSALDDLVSIESDARDCGIEESLVRDIFARLGRSDEAALQAGGADRLRALCHEAVELTLTQQRQRRRDLALHRRRRGGLKRRLRPVPDELALAGSAQSNMVLREGPTLALVNDWMEGATWEASRCGVPLVLAALSRHLRRFGLRTEGIFRVSPDATELQSVRCRAELFGVHDVIAQQPSAECVAALIKTFLGSLPTPVFNELAERRLADRGKALLAAELDAQAKAEAEAGDEAAAAATAMVIPADVKVAQSAAVGAFVRLLRGDNMPEPMSEASVATLRYVLHLLGAVVDHADRNKMTAPNLAKMLGPVLARNPAAGAGADGDAAQIRAAVQRSSWVNASVQVFIEHHEEIFSELDQSTGFFDDDDDDDHELDSDSTTTTAHTIESQSPYTATPSAVGTPSYPNDAYSQHDEVERVRERRRGQQERIRAVNHQSSSQEDHEAPYSIDRGELRRIRLQRRTAAAVDAAASDTAAHDAAAEVAAALAAARR